MGLLAVRGSIAQGSRMNGVKAERYQWFEASAIKLETKLDFDDKRDGNPRMAADAPKLVGLWCYAPTDMSGQW